MKRLLTFTKEERARLAVLSQALGIHFEEFVHDAAMQACDEMEGRHRERARRYVAARTWLDEIVADLMREYLETDAARRQSMKFGLGLFADRVAKRLEGE